MAKNHIRAKIHHPHQPSQNEETSKEMVGRQEVGKSRTSGAERTRDKGGMDASTQTRIAIQKVTGD